VVRHRPARSQASGPCRRKASNRGCTLACSPKDVTFPRGDGVMNGRSRAVDLLRLSPPTLTDTNAGLLPKRLAVDVHAPALGYPHKSKSWSLRGHRKPPLDRPSRLWRSSTTLSSISATRIFRDVSIHCPCNPQEAVSSGLPSRQSFRSSEAQK
jgi:hypothetical protein